MDDSVFLALALALSVVAGGVASVAGFGIGSLITPLLTWRLGATLAVAVVSIPHAVATAMRLWQLRRAIDREVLARFGVASALGGLVGALGHAAIRGTAASLVLGAVLIVAGTLGATGLTKKMRFGRTGAWVAGVASGAFGGLVGNQGGIRSAALLGFDVSRDAFVATATATALLVDAARVPVYVALRGDAIAGQAPLVAVTVAGAAIGTLLGRHLLARVPEAVFARVVSGIVLALGALVIVGAALGWPGFSGAS